MTEDIHLSLRESLHLYGRICALLRPHLLSTWGTIGCTIVATGLSLVIPNLIGHLIDTSLRVGSTASLWPVALAILGVSALRGLFAYGQGYLSQAVSQKVAYDLRDSMYAHLQHLSFAYHDRSETGQLMSRMTADIEAVRNFMTLGLLRAAVAVITFVAVSAIMLAQSLPLTLLTWLSLPPTIIIAIRVGRQMRPIWLSVQNELGALGTVMQESLSGMKVVKAFAREEYEIERFRAQNIVVRRLMMRAQRMGAFNAPLLVFILNVITALLIWVGGLSVIGRHLSLGTLVAITQYVLILGAPVRVFGFMVTWFSRALGAGVRVFDLLDAPSPVQQLPQAVDLPAVMGHVRFEDVSFGYDPPRLVLEHISIDAQPGQVIALLGAAGSGKTTLIHLVPRFYDVTAGRITIDGIDISQVTLPSLRRNIGLVLQDVFLFNATIRDNIAYGSPHATDEQVLAAARAARIHEFIHRLPDGYETWVGERGVTLSGGQKQRIAIARTLLLDPRILILDDATSSVDMETEYLIQQALAEVMRGRTTFVVASRLRTIKSANQIIVLDHGRIVERGTHDSLLARGGVYTQLYDVQLRDQEESASHLPPLPTIAQVRP